MEEKKNTKLNNQTVLLENRERLSVSGVIDVDSFNDESIVAMTDLGVLIIRGAGLHISKLCLETNQLIVEGDIFSMEYSDETVKSKSFLGRMFR